MRTILEITQDFLGTKELGDNAGFENIELQNNLASLGWVPGQSWCGYKCMDSWFRYFSQEVPGFKDILLQIKHILHPHVKTMWERAKKSPFVQVGQIPKVGAIVCWRVGNGGKGHAGIVTAVNEDGSFTTKEGNTSVSSKYNQSNGDGYYEKQRYLISKSQLNLWGFIYLPEPK